MRSTIIPHTDILYTSFTCTILYIMYDLDPDTNNIHDTTQTREDFQNIRSLVFSRCSSMEVYKACGSGCQGRPKEEKQAWFS